MARKTPTSKRRLSSKRKNVSRKASGKSFRRTPKKSRRKFSQKVHAYNVFQNYANHFIRNKFNQTAGGFIDKYIGKEAKNIILSDTAKGGFGTFDKVYDKVLKLIKSIPAAGYGIFAFLGLLAFMIYTAGPPWASEMIYSAVQGIYIRLREAVGYPVKNKEGTEGVEAPGAGNVQSPEEPDAVKKEKEEEVITDTEVKEKGNVEYGFPAAQPGAAEESRSGNPGGPVEFTLFSRDEDSDEGSGAGLNLPGTREVRRPTGHRSGSRSPSPGRRLSKSSSSPGRLSQRERYANILRSFNFQ